jgi:hypothetical protein
MRLHVAYARVGPVKFIALPGEFSPELVVGVPRDFDTPDLGVRKYYRRPALHATGPAYVLPGPSVHPLCLRGVVTWAVCSAYYGSLIVMMMTQARSPTCSTARG